MACLAEFASWLRLCPAWDNCSEKKSELQRQKTDVGRCWGVAEFIVPASGFHELLSYSKLMCLVNTLFKKITVPPFIFRWIMYHAHSQTISHWIPPITCSGRCDFFLYYRWENWGSGKYSHFAHSLLAQISKLSDSKACAFSYHINLFSKENKCDSDESSPESIHLLFGLVAASLGTSIQENGSTEGTPDFQAASCAQGLTVFFMRLSLDILFCVALTLSTPAIRDTRTLLVPNFIAVTTEQTRAELGEEFFLPASVNNIIVELIFLLISIWFWSCQKEDGKFDPYIAFFCSEKYKIFPGFIYLSHFPGGIFHGKQRMNRFL